MRTLLRLLPMLTLLAPLQVFGGTTATMQVSFTVVASCAVDVHGTSAPGVNCGQSVGFIVAPQAVANAGIVSRAGNNNGNSDGSSGGNSGAGWTVYF